MSRGLFITATGTDVGKTYVSALIIKALRKSGINCGYYKAAVSGAGSIAESDAGYVNAFAKIGQREETLLSYLYKTPVSPHLAAQIEGNPLSLAKVKADYLRVCKEYDYVVTEGSGGIICPLRWDDEEKVLLEEVINLLGLPTVVVAAAGLGTINATVLTVKYLKAQGIPVKGIILNYFTGDEMQVDNLKMIEELTGISVIATVKPGDMHLDICPVKLAEVFQEEEI
ncbi:MAG: dethiobiotin synthase [Clostridium sp.]|uniref:dethiobiotin synthase n=1 Tax=Clostridium sp. TaxID=1506 RepID=UPI00306A95C3